MTRVGFTEFRRNASDLLTRVERGEVLVVMRHGRAIAEIAPVVETADHVPAWKRPGLKLVSKGAGLSLAVIEERTRESIL